MSNFCSQSALMVSKSESIIRRLNNDYPTLSRLFAYNREGTIGFLKANGGLYGFSLSHDFNVPHTGDDNYKAWSEYRNAIERYLERICDRVKANDPHNGGGMRSFREELKPARKILSDEIHYKHYLKFPLWPAEHKEQESLVELDTGSSYDHGAYTIVWSCAGWIKVTDKRPQYNKYVAEFSGKPDLKLLALDNDKLRMLENVVREKGIEAGKSMVNMPRSLTWDQLF